MARRAPELVEFEGRLPDGLLVAYEAMLEARAGWINLLPEVEEPEGGVRRRILESQVPTSMGTAVPARSRRRPVPRLGVAHPLGKVAPRDLEAAGCPLPAGWRLVSSQARRGLVVDPDPSASAAEQLGWLVAATLALCPLPTTGKLRAELHAPRG